MTSILIIVLLSQMDMLNSCKTSQAVFDTALFFCESYPLISVISTSLTFLQPLTSPLQPSSLIIEVTHNLTFCLLFFSFILLPEPRCPIHDFSYCPDNCSVPDVELPTWHLNLIVLKTPQTQHAQNRVHDVNILSPHLHRPTQKKKRKP